MRKVAGRQVDREKEAITGIMGVLRVDSIMMHYRKLFSPLILSSSNFRNGFKTRKKKEVVNFMVLIEMNGYRAALYGTSPTPNRSFFRRLIFYLDNLQDFFSYSI